eukprot:TRINITY_DN1508_c0_g1_i11.p1 TRINITY_DN1508_c0_g1~~TRINITY_DN1508_c0_g1_i11.p1  ORF type:complete len:173 (-),score=32.33 TRINITY_DN1508_c0_g1_i11:154-672(-)
MGMNIFKHNFESPTLKTNFQFHIWDCSGEERYFALCQKLCSFCHIAVVIYDSSSVDSIATLKLWFPELRRSKFPIVPQFLGTKMDLVDNSSNQVPIVPSETPKSTSKSSPPSLADSNTKITRPKFLEEIRVYAEERNVTLSELSVKRGDDVVGLLDGWCKVFIENQANYDHG